MKHIKKKELFEGSIKKYKSSEGVEMVWKTSSDSLVYPYEIDKTGITNLMSLFGTEIEYNTSRFVNIFDWRKKEVLPDFKKKLSKEMLKFIDEMVDTFGNWENLSRINKVYECTINPKIKVFNKNGKEIKVASTCIYAFGHWGDDIFALTNGKIERMGKHRNSITDYRVTTIDDLIDKWEKAQEVDKFFALRQYLLLRKDKDNDYCKLMDALTNKKDMKDIDIMHNLDDLGIFDDD